MRTLAILSTLFAVGVAPFAGAGGGREASLPDFSDKLAKAQSLSFNETVQAVNGAAENVKVSFTKPNKVRIDFGNQLIVADGTNVYTLDKTRKVYMKEAQNAKSLSGLLAGQDLAIWSTFFGTKAFDVTKAKDGGPQSLNGQTLEKVTFNLGPTSVVGYLNTESLLVKAILLAPQDSGQGNTVLNVSDLAVDGSLPAGTFEFKAPGETQEVSAEDFRGFTWYTDLSQAEEAAQKNNKHIFVDFMASWCGPCKMLDREVFTTDRFKQTSKSFVFLRVDVDQQPTVSKNYGIEAMPTQMVLDENGKILGKTVGYGGPDAFFSFITPFLLN
jgi:outer membrane lipoprotein-sorting protein